MLHARCGGWGIGGWRSSGGGGLWEARGACKVTGTHLVILVL